MPGPLLNPDGTLTEPGWATDLLLKYDRSRIKVPGFRIKEWDYYCILSENYGVAFTVADNGYLGFVSVTILDLIKKEETTKTVMTPFPLGSFRMPETSRKGDVIFRKKGVFIKIRRKSGERTITVDIPSFHEGRNLTGTLRLIQPEDMDSMVIATPFQENRRAFYYNQKVNCLRAEGSLEYGDRALLFDPSTDFGVLDWGRGVWTYANTWYWGSASGIVGGELFGFNIGYGFGDTSAATENMLFYKGKAHKLDEVTFNIPEPEFLLPWTFTSSDGRFEMDFMPILDRFSDTNALIIRSCQHQVFGRFSGKAVLDDGSVLEIKNLLGFAEKVKNRW